VVDPVADNPYFQRRRAVTDPDRFEVATIVGDAEEAKARERRVAPAMTGPRNSPVGREGTATPSPDSMDQLCINTIRTLSIDAVEQADSGHPGTPMALAPVVYTLWQRFLRFDPEDPIWPNRDRFVLSNGHASMLLYAVLHLTGVKAVNAEYERLGEPSVTLDDIKRFRETASVRAILSTT
jgi:transketolase